VRNACLTLRNVCETLRNGNPGLRSKTAKRQGTLRALPFLRDLGKPDELNGLNGLN
jgi:hypothetical protein